MHGVFQCSVFFGLGLILWLYSANLAYIEIKSLHTSQHAQ